MLPRKDVALKVQNATLAAASSIRILRYLGFNIIIIIIIISSSSSSR
jgi:hypothetical protein